jgi:hypothetical protein
METLNDLMQAYAKDAVTVSRKQYGILLDYSADSIRHIEAFAADFHADMPRGRYGKLFRNPPDPAKVEGVCMSLGGYVGEVLRRTKGGNWDIQPEVKVWAWSFPTAPGCIRPQSFTGGSWTVRRTISSPISPW